MENTKILASSPITSWQIEKEKVEDVTDFIFLDSKITGDSDYNHEIKRHSLLGKKAMITLVQFSCSVMSDSLQPHEVQHARPPCPSPTPAVHSNSRPRFLFLTLPSYVFSLPVTELCTEGFLHSGWTVCCGSLEEESASRSFWIIQISWVVSDHSSKMLGCLAALPASQME